jgi:hypothetical protein
MLFNLRHDVNERNDLYRPYSDVMADLKDRLAAREADMAVVMPDLLVK